MFIWADLNGLRHIGVGTNLKYYVENGGGVLTDITPLKLMAMPANCLSTTNGQNTIQVNLPNHGLTTSNYVLIQGASDVNGILAADINLTFPVNSVVDANNFTVLTVDTAVGTGSGGGSGITILANQDIYVPLTTDPLATTSGSSIVTVTHNNHGGSAGDFVKYSGLTAVGGLTISGEYQINSVTSANVYTIMAVGTAGSTTTGGGSAGFAQYQIPVGPQDYTVNYGWGSGGWGVSGWGAAGAQGTGTAIRLWSAQNFGQDLVINPRGGGIYYYSTASGNRAVDIRLQPDNNNAPSACNSILVSATNKQIIAFGVNPIGSSTIDPLFIRWSDSASAGNWFATAVDAAGGFRLSIGSEIKCATNSVGEILVFTDAGLTAMTPVGGGFVYGNQLLSPNIDIISPESVIAIDDAAFWMGKENFFIYSGRAQAMPCTVRQYVFNDINLGQSAKIQAGSNRLYREVWWLYPSANSIEIDRYVVFNYAENTWYYGTLPRTAWADAGLTNNNNPVAASTDGYLYYHENGWDDGSTSPPSPVNAYITSGPVELGSGDRIAFLRRVIPDVTFERSEVGNPSVEYDFYPQLYPGAPLGTPDDGGGVVAQVTGSPTFEQFTQKINLRLRGRQFVMKVSSSALGVSWRLGIQRFDAQPDGGR